MSWLQCLPLQPPARLTACPGSSYLTGWGGGYFLGLSTCSRDSFPSVWLLQCSAVNRTQQAELTPTRTKQICSRVPLMRYLPVNRFPQYPRGQVSRKLLGTKFKIILPTQHPGNFSAIQEGPAAPSQSRSGSAPQIRLAYVQRLLPSYPAFYANTLHPSTQPYLKFQLQYFGVYVLS